MSARWLLALLLAAACTNDHELGETSASLGATRWAVTTGGPDIDYGKAVAIDNAGDVIAGGVVISDLSVGNSYITKLAAADGSMLWTHRLDATVSLNTLAATPDGGAIAAGDIAGDATFDGTELVDRGNDSFVVKYDATGRALWASGLSKDSRASIESLAVALDGQIYASGNCWPDPDDGALGQVVVAGTARHHALRSRTSVPCSGAFVAAFDPDGTLLWFRGYEAVGDSASWSRLPLLAMPDGKILAVSSIDSDPVTLDDLVVTPRAVSSILLAEIRPTGGIATATVIGDPDVAQDAQQVAATMTGFITVGVRGSVQGTITEWDENGYSLWSTTTDQPFAILALAVTDLGAVMSAGAEQGNIDGDYGAMFVMTHSPEGQYLEERSYGGALGRALPGAVATGPSGQLAFVGRAWGQADVGTGPLANAGSSDMLVGLIGPPPM